MGLRPPIDDGRIGGPIIRPPVGGGPIRPPVIIDDGGPIVLPWPRPRPPWIPPRPIPVHGTPRASCTSPISPTAGLQPGTLFEPVDPADARRFYLPQFDVAQSDVDGQSRFRVRLGRDAAGTGWQLDVAFSSKARAGGSEPMGITVTPVLTFTTASGLQREHPLVAAQESANVYTASMLLPGLNERDELYHAMTKPEWRAKFVLRCQFNAALPGEVSETGEQLYREGPQLVDVPIDRDFNFAPNLHGYVYKGIEDVQDGSAQLIPRTVAWKGRTHLYYQEDRTPYLFRYLPDGVYLTRTEDRPLRPSMRVRFTSPDDSLENMRALIEYAATPVVDAERLLDAAKQLKAHLPSQLPTGVTGPIFEPLVVTDPEKLRLDVSVPRAGGGGSPPVARPGVVKNLADAFSDQITDLSVDGFQEIFDALFGSSAVVFAGAVTVGEQGNRPATSIPFVARLKDLHGPVFALEEKANADGSVQLTLTNASESPLVVRAVPAQLAPKDAAPVEARLEALKVAGKAVTFPVELKPDQALKARVVPTATQPPPVLQRGAVGKAVEQLQAALVKAGAKIDVDGDFGKKTETAIKAFQTKKGLPVTGIADDATNAALKVKGLPIALPGPVEGRYDLRQFDEKPDREAVWTAIYDPAVKPVYKRVIQVEALEEWFKPHTDISAIAIDFDTGDQVKLGPNKLSGEAKIDVPLEDLIVRKQRESEYGYTQITIRGTKQVREKKTDTLDILFPEVSPPPGG